MGAVCVLSLGVGGAIAADEAIMIKIKKRSKGEMVKETKTEVTKYSVAVMAGEMNINQEGRDTGTFVFTDEVIEQADGAKRPTKLKRIYDKAEGQERGTAVEYQLAGKTVVIEKGKDKYTFAIDGKPVTGSAAEKLDKEFNKKSDLEVEDVMLPKKPVKVGDTWELDGKQLAEVFGDEMELDIKKVKGSGKLVKVYDKDGRKNGVIEMTLELPIVKMIGKGEEKAMGAGSFMKMELTMDGCIDGTATGGVLKGKLGGTMKFSEMGANVTVTLDGTMDSKIEPVTKK
jgi:hypothetical protein